MLPENPYLIVSNLKEYYENENIKKLNSILKLWYNEVDCDKKRILTTIYYAALKLKKQFKTKKEIKLFSNYIEQIIDNIMDKKFITSFNEKCAIILGAKNIFKTTREGDIYQFDFEIDVKESWDEGGYNGTFGETNWGVLEMKFNEDWNWIMHVVNAIADQGFRKYTYSHEEHARCVFTDMAILSQNHQFGGGNIVSDSGKCSNEKEAVIMAINNIFSKLDLN